MDRPQGQREAHILFNGQSLADTAPGQLPWPVNGQELAEARAQIPDSAAGSNARSPPQREMDIDPEDRLFDIPALPSTVPPVRQPRSPFPHPHSDTQTQPWLGRSYPSPRLGDTHLNTTYRPGYGFLPPEHTLSHAPPLQPEHRPNTMHHGHHGDPLRALPTRPPSYYPQRPTSIYDLPPPENVQNSSYVSPVGGVFADYGARYQAQERLRRRIEEAQVEIDMANDSLSFHGGTRARGPDREPVGDSGQMPPRPEEARHVSPHVAAFIDEYHVRERERNAAGRRQYQRNMRIPLTNHYAGREEENDDLFRQAHANAPSPRSLGLARRTRRAACGDRSEASNGGSGQENKSYGQNRPEPVSEADMCIMMRCLSCYEQVANVALIPCGKCPSELSTFPPFPTDDNLKGHCILCEWCLETMQATRDKDKTHPRGHPHECPMCRTKVTKAVLSFCQRRRVSMADLLPQQRIYGGVSVAQEQREQFLNESTAADKSAAAESDK